MYMLDTNICIHLLQGQPQSVRDKFAMLSEGDVVMSAITYAELRHGVERLDSRQRSMANNALAALIAKIPVLPFDVPECVAYGSLAAKSKRTRDALDKLIAAHAVSVNAILVTNNIADFRGYAGLVVENWISAD